MGKYVSYIFLGALAIALSIFTGSRTLDLLAWALPPSQQVYQWLGLVAFEGGMYFWTFYFISGAKGTPQRSISVLMAILSIVVVSITTVVDMTVDASKAGKVQSLSGQESEAVIIFLGAVVALNVAAYMACHLLSIDNLRNMREHDAEDQIYDAGLKAIKALAPSIAGQAAPHLAEEWANRTWQRIVPGAQGRTEYLAAAPARPAIAPPVQQSIDSQAPKRGFLGLFKKKESVTYQPGAQSIDYPVDDPAAPSEYTSNRLYRDLQRARRRAPSSVAAQRMANRQARYAKGTVQPPLARLEKVTLNQEDQAGAAPTKSTPSHGSSTRKQGAVPGATNGNSKSTRQNRKS